MKRIPVIVAVFLAATIPLFCGTAVAGVIQSSLFDVDAEGWSVVNHDGSGSPRAPVWVAPGFLRIGDVFDVGFWNAPGGWLGDRIAAYGGTLEYDMRELYTPPYEDNDIYLEGGGLEVFLDDAGSPPGIDWTHYVVQLSTLAPWRVSTTGNPLATAEQLKQVLGSLTALRIRAEYHVGADQVDFDNVYLYSGANLVPEPSALVLGMTGVLILLAGRRISLR